MNNCASTIKFSKTNTMDYLSFTKTAKFMTLKDLYEYIQLRMFCFGVQAVWKYISTILLPYSAKL